MKKTFIVTTYNSYEWIKTEDAYCKLELMIKYHLKGYKVWDYPMWFAKLVYKLFKKPILTGKTAMFELRIPGSDQITYWSAYDNFR